MAGVLKEEHMLVSFVLRVLSVFYRWKFQGRSPGDCTRILIRCLDVLVSMLIILE